MPERPQPDLTANAAARRTTAWDAVQRRRSPEVKDPRLKNNEHCRMNTAGRKDETKGRKRRKKELKDQKSFQELREGWRVALPRRSLWYVPLSYPAKISFLCDHLNPYFSCTVHIGVI